MQSLVDALNAPVIQPKVVQNIALEIVELYPYVEYMKYLLAGSVTLAMYVAVMIGGGMLYIDDKARGVHEGYLVTPITRLELVLGLNLAGTIKAVLSGVCLTVIGSSDGGPGCDLQPGVCPAAPAADPVDLDRVQRDDVPHDGARRRSPGAARHVWSPEHAAVLSQRSDLSDHRISPMAEGDCGCRSFYLCSPRLQGSAAQGWRLDGDPHGPAVSCSDLGSRRCWWRLRCSSGL